MREAQEAEFGPLKKVTKTKNWLLNEEGVLVLITKNGPRTIVPKVLVPLVLKRAHGDGDVGHYGITRSAVRLIKSYYWPGWLADLKQLIAKCLTCEGVRIGRMEPPKQTPMTVYQVERRFQLVARDVLKISPKSQNGFSKVLVIGDAFTRFMMSIPIRNDNMRTLATTFFSRWVTIFGPPKNSLPTKARPWPAE